ncbi:RidA family protein [Sphingopyxis sp. CCNWLW253]|jgi:enamine deaminase RidA (YjgF/YER057c/UK114 family)|uniref:RidA family protein n=1 Tax=unclassified Sphingopyxis TaxID=2614943 RepID=UPI003012BB28
MNEIARLRSAQRASLAVIHNGVVYLAGMTAKDDRSQDVRGQTVQALERIDALLAEAGTDRSRLLTAQIWLKNIERDFAAMNEVWDAWVAPNASPTRATAQCEMGAPDVLVEIIVSAATASDR